MAGQQPSKGTRVTDKERQQIIDAIKGGKSIHAVAKEFRRSKQTIGKIARQAGLDADTTSTQAASTARVRYAEAERLELINKGFDKVAQVLEAIEGDPDHAKPLREVVTALGILIDKRRLEDGEATERAETVTIIDDIPRE